MTKVSWRPYEKGDEESLRSKRAPKRGTQEWENFTRNIARTPVYTFIDPDDQVLGIGGFLFYRRGNAEVWNMLNDDALHMPGLARAVRELLHRKQEEWRLPRVWATGEPAESELLSRWFEFLGLEHEGIVEAWGPHGQDQMFFARIRRFD